MQDLRRTYASARALQYSVIMSDESGVLCTGREDYAAEATLSETSSSIAGYSAVADFGVGRTWYDVDADGNVRLQINVPGLERRSGGPGLPDVPAYRALIAAPPGATVSVSASPTIRETFRGDLNPVHLEPMDQAGDEGEGEGDLFREPYFVAPRFTNRAPVRDETIYGTDAYFPENIATLYPVGRMRGLDLYQLSVHAAQFNPVSQTVQLFEEVSFNVTFSGGASGFLFEGFDGPFESNPGVFLGAALNADIIPGLPKAPLAIAPTETGEEFMILTHPDFKVAADALAAWKNEKGIMTKVYECGTDSGIAGRETNAEINAFIDAHYDAVTIKPSYILLFGDSEHIAPFLITRKADISPDTIGTDWPYAVKTYPSDEFPTLVPTFAVG